MLYFLFQFIVVSFLFILFLHLTEVSLIFLFGPSFPILAKIGFSWRRMGGSADITTITHQQASESLEETLIAPKLTKIEFPQFLRKVSASSVVVVMND